MIGTRLNSNVVKLARKKYPNIYSGWNNSIDFLQGDIGRSTLFSIPVSYRIPATCFCNLAEPTSSGRCGDVGAGHYGMEVDQDLDRRNLSGISSKIIELIVVNCMTTQMTENRVSCTTIRGWMSSTCHICRQIACHILESYLALLQSLISSPGWLALRDDFSKRLVRLFWPQSVAENIVLALGASHFHCHLRLLSDGLQLSGLQDTQHRSVMAIYIMYISLNKTQK